MCVRVLRVSGMPHNVQVWVDDGIDCFTVYIDKSLITERGASTLELAFSTTVAGWRRIDESSVIRALQAITG